ncbi:hypothetical protein DAQ1742_03351 [Dickeya aquatica]|uniref:Uncharacterized protein n=1 Tax=Dickeya aquatica TaxID=1401087 RepID=A0A375ADK0_9GAMM|nr:hypothetical protein DAQ1742_03351 [Dickeya aquatica]
MVCTFPNSKTLNDDFCMTVRAGLVKVFFALSNLPDFISH